MMIRVLQRSSSVSLYTKRWNRYSNPSSSSLYYCCNRTFFDSSSSGSSKDNDDKNGNDSDHDKDDDKDTTITKDENKNKTTTRTTTTTPTIVVPTKLPFGESAPRLPHMTAIPLVSRPLFPGLITSVTLTDERTIDALEEIHTKGNSYISCFLRAKHSTGVISETGVVLTTPELITDISDLYKTGTFAQIQRLTRGVANPKPTEYNSDGESTSHTGASSSGESYSAATMILLAHRRVDLLSVDNIGPPIDVTVKHWPRMEYITTLDGNNKNNHDSIRAISNEIISTIREVAQMNLLFRENLQLFPMRFDANDPYKLADFAASICATGTPDDLQGVLDEIDPEIRLHKSLVLLIREREVSKLQKEISAKVEEKMTEAQRKYFLTEQLKSIKKELGMERDEKDAIIDKYRTKLKEFIHALPVDIVEVIDSELDKFSTLEKNSAEYNVTRTYLDWLIHSIPWNVYSTENYNLDNAKHVLDREHYGLDDVKNIILQFIAVSKLKQYKYQYNQKQQEGEEGTDNDMKKDDKEQQQHGTNDNSIATSSSGKILCFAGPPGTGKTSIANSIANALGRKFYRFSVGGLSDVSEIKGHRRTYIGAMPGKIIQCLKATGTFNAVCLIDEIDKLGTGYRGDPASALLEVLDPSQNSTYRDHFIDLPIDISKILFICTANELDRIPGPLLDRMEIIRLSGYDFPEKVTIAEQYLIPKSMKDNGLMIDPIDQQTKEEVEKNKQNEEQKDSESNNVEINNAKTPFEDYIHAPGVPPTLQVTKEAIASLVRWYAREAGVRNLGKYINQITRKLALQVVAESEGTVLSDKAKRKSDTWIIDEHNLAEYVGKPIFTSDRLYEHGPLPSGIIMGLAYTSMGGTSLYIETQGIQRGLDENGKPRGGGSLKATGQLGDVMQESSQIAYTVARARLAKVTSDDTNKEYQHRASYFDLTDIHMHVPEGATPKDGPSAGVTMVTSMLSLALDKPIPNDLAMTGEISLTGKVLAVGGIKEKIMAAKRANIKHVILPDANRRDYDEIPQYLKENLIVHYADHYDKVYDIAFNGASSTE